jgi:undecaprenyl-diphosphatase
LLAQTALGMEPSLLLTVLMHLGTLVAVLAVFWRDWWKMLRHPLKSRVLWMLVIATVPAAVAGWLLGDAVENVLQTPEYVGFFFLVTALLLVAAELFSRNRGRVGRHARRQDVESVNVGQAVAMGFMQAVAIVPGVSRSGSTITGGMLTGLNRGTASKFSFMMSAPIILGSAVFEAKNAFSGLGATIQQSDGLALLAGVLVAAVSGYLAIRWMLRLVRRVPLYWFALYAGVLGALVIAHFNLHLL